jgi:hypothetical protein
MKLIHNLTEAYWPKVKINMWRHLKSTLLESNSFIKDIIGDDEDIADQLATINHVLQSKLTVT